LVVLDRSITSAAPAGIAEASEVTGRLFFPCLHDHDPRVVHSFRGHPTTSETPALTLASRVGLAERAGVRIADEPH